MSPNELDDPILRLDRAYCAADAARILRIGVTSFNERVRAGVISPIPMGGDRRFSGFELARLLGWPLTDDPRDYMPKSEPTFHTH